MATTALEPATPSEKGATPMMAQFIEIKAANPDCLLFYRMGDFYELFFDDAEIAARALGIALTKRGQHAGRDVPMAGVPVHAADDYLQKLIRLGHRVAVCEQTETPADAKKRAGSKALVRRDVVRLVTPGTLTEEKLLDPAQANALAVIARVRSGETASEWAIALVDISDGTFRIVTSDASQVASDIARLSPTEIVAPDTLDDPELLSRLETVAPVTLEPAVSFNGDGHTLARKLGIASLDALGIVHRAEIAAASGALAYLDRTQKGQMPSLSMPSREAERSVLAIDAATRAQLELTRTLAGEREGSLLHTIDRTVSPGGARELGARLASPLTEPDTINDRLDAVGLLMRQDVLRERLRDALRRLPDMPRALSRIALDRAGPRDLSAIARGLRTATDLRAILGGADLSPALERERARLEEVPAGLVELLEAALGDDLPLLKRDGGFVREGFNERLDEVRRLSRDTRQVIAGLQEEYASQTGTRLRIKHNALLGYFIEVNSKDAAALQADETFIHRQTMASAMRFSTSRLAELQSAIADAGGEALAIELGVFEDCVRATLAETDPIRTVASAAANVDVHAALGTLAEEQGWARPIVDGSRDFVVTAGRHPVVEQALRSRAEPPFVSNDCELGDGAIWLLTGPNMGGKSTFLRQNALIAVLAQMGSFVPAGAARIGVVDQVYSRVGAADDLASGRSTFMVEMVETAAILRGATERSLVILDEMGRGTSTFDGLSLAWASIEHLHETNGCRTLFATHYHELTALSEKLPRMTNRTMKVREWKGDVVFLHEVGEGAADRSYGIQVARLAGLPVNVIERARTVLEQLESSERAGDRRALVDDLPLFAVKSETSSRTDELRDALRDVNPDDMTPREAQETLYRLRRILHDEPRG